MKLLVEWRNLTPIFTFLTERENENKSFHREEIASTNHVSRVSLYIQNLSYINTMPLQNVYKIYINTYKTFNFPAGRPLRSCDPREVNSWPAHTQLHYEGSGRRVPARERMGSRLLVDIDYSICTVYSVTSLSRCFL